MADSRLLQGEEQEALEGDTTPGRQSLGETWREEGVLPALGQAGQMLLPSFLTQGGVKSFGDLSRDFAEWTLAGDIKDAWAGFTGEADGQRLDWWERLLGITTAVPGIAGRAVAAYGLGTQARATWADRMQRFPTETPVSPARSGSMRTHIDPVTGQRIVKYGIVSDTEIADAMSSIGGGTTRQINLYGTPTEVPAFTDQALTDPKAEVEVASMLTNRAMQMISPDYGIMRATSVEHVFDVAFDLGVMRASEGPAELYLLGREIVDGAAERGIVIEGHRPNGTPLPMDEQVLAAGKYAVRVLQTLKEQRPDFWKDMRGRPRAEFFVALMDAGYGPDLSRTPTSSLADVQEVTLGGFNAHVVITEHTHLPDVRLFDPRTTHLLDHLEMSNRFMQLNVSNAMGNMALNKLRLFEAMEGSPSFEFNKTWYARANKMIRGVSENIGAPVPVIAAVLAEMSKQTKWVPDNLIGGLHLLVQQYRPDLEVDSDGYRAIIRQAVEDGGFGDVLRQYGKPELRNSDIETVIDFYTLDANSKENLQSGERRFMGTDVKKIQLIKELLEMGLPPELAFATLKRGNFQYALAEPTEFMANVVDTHDFTAATGFLFPIVRMENGKLKKRPDVLFDTRERRAGEEVLQAGTFRIIGDEEYNTIVRVLTDAGLTEAEAKKRATSLQRILTDESRRRTEAIMMASSVVAEYKNVLSNEVQAGIWDPVKAMKQVGKWMVRSSKEGKSYQSMRQIVWSDFFLSMMEGQSMFDPGVVAAVANPSSDPAPFFAVDWSRVQRKSKRADVPQPRVWTVDGPSGTLVVADKTDVSAMRALRHLAPMPIQGDIVPMLPRRSHPVSDVAQVITDLEKVKDAPGEITYRTTMATPDIGKAGNRISVVVRHEAKDALLEAVDGAILGAEVKALPITVGRFGEPEGGRRIRDPLPDDSTVAEVRAALDTHQWVAISSDRPEFIGFELHGRRMELRRMVEELGGTYFEAEGRYGGEIEDSLLVFGLDYEQAMALAERFDQESVLTPYGLIYTEDGALRPGAGLVEMTADAPDATTFKAEDGKGAFVMEIDFEMDQADLPRVSANTLNARTPHTGAATEIIIDLDGTNNDHHWSKVDDLLWTLRMQEGIESISYANHGATYTPRGWVPQYETHYTDAAGRTLIAASSRPSGSWNEREVWVPARQVSGSYSGSLPSSRRSAAEARKLMRVDEAGNRITINADLEMRFPPGSEVEVQARGALNVKATNPADPDAGPELVRDWALEFREMRRGVAQTPILTPVFGARPGNVGLRYGPGLARIFKQSNGWRLEVANQADLVPALQAMMASGIDPNSVNAYAASVVVPIQADVWRPPSGPFYRPMLEAVERSWPGTPTTEKAVQLARNVRRITEDENFSVYLPRADDGQIALLDDVVTSLYSTGTRYSAFRERFGDIPIETLRYLSGFYTAEVDERTFGEFNYIPGTGAVVRIDPYAFIADRALPLAAILPSGYHSTDTGLEHTYVHELAHAIHFYERRGQGPEMFRHGRRRLKPGTVDTTIQNFVDFQGPDWIGRNVSEYGTANHLEAWAEVFTKAVLTPARLSPPEAKLVEDVLSILRKMEEK